MYNFQKRLDKNPNCSENIVSIQKNDYKKILVTHKLNKAEDGWCQFLGNVDSEDYTSGVEVTQEEEEDLNNLKRIKKTEEEELCNVIESKIDSISDMYVSMLREEAILKKLENQLDSRKKIVSNEIQKKIHERNKLRELSKHYEDAENSLNFMKLTRNVELLDSQQRPDGSLRVKIQLLSSKQVELTLNYSRSVNSKQWILRSVTMSEDIEGSDHIVSNAIVGGEGTRYLITELSSLIESTNASKRSSVNEFKSMN